jgi:hypothetical protein
MFLSGIEIPGLFVVVGQKEETAKADRDSDYPCHMSIRACQHGSLDLRSAIKVDLQ